MSAGSNVTLDRVWLVQARVSNIAVFSQTRGSSSIIKDDDCLPGASPQTRRDSCISVVTSAS